MGDIVINLFNLDIKQITHNSDRVVLISLNGDIVYEDRRFLIEYTVNNTIDGYLSDAFIAESGPDSGEEFRIGLPRLYTGDFPYGVNPYESPYINDYVKLKIICTDGTVTNNPKTELKVISKVMLWFPSNTYAIRFFGDTVNSCVVSTVDYCDTSNFDETAYMFYNCNLTSINCSNWNTSEVDNMHYMFYQCYYLTELDLSNWDVSQVDDMGHMFQNCISLTTINMDNWDTSDCQNMARMFSGCEKLTTLTGIENFELNGTGEGTVHGVQSTSYMFYNCTSLTELDLSNWDVSQVTDMDGMFSGCDSLTELDLSNWTTPNLTDTDSMFSFCKNLTTLDVSSLNMKNVTGSSWMFYNCPALTNLNPPRNINCDLNIRYSKNLTHDSLLSLIYQLMQTTTTKTLTLGADNLAKLTAEEKAIATNKGWSLSS